MKRILTLIVTAAMAVALTPAASFAEENAAGHFKDVDSGAWYVSAVNYVVSNGIMNGTSSSAFEPDSCLTRGMIVQMLYNMEDRPSGMSGAGFRDVAAGAWYRDAVNWAAQSGIVNGVSSTEFAPEDPVTREQAAAIMYRYADFKGYDTSALGNPDRFTDAGRISSWARNSMTWAVGTKLLGGMGDGTIAPQGTATRAQMAQIFKNFGNLSGEIKLTDLAADETNFLAGQRESVLFTVRAGGLKNSAVDLCSENGRAASMRDDGRNGDAKAGDGIYSCRLSQTKEAGSYIYYASSGNIKSSRMTLTYYRQPTQADADAGRRIQDRMEEIGSVYKAADGCVPQDRTDEALAAVAGYAQSLEESGDALSSDVSENSVTIDLATGLSLCYVPEVKDTDSVGADVSMTVVTCQPCLSMYGSDMAEIMTYPDAAASKIGSAFKNYSYPSSGNYDNGEVTLDRIRSFQPNEIVLWHGHGFYTGKYRSCLLTGEDFNWTKWYWDPVYFLDCCQKRIIESTNAGRAAVSSKYIDKYCGNLDNSLFYLAACCSGQDDALAGAFLNKGAAAVVGNTETINTGYDVVMEAETAGNLAEINPDTGNYYTLGESLAFAREKWGNNDSKYKSDGAPAEAKIFGGSGAEGYRLADAPDEASPDVLHTGGIGSTVTFGTYEQDKNDADGAEPIEWQVLDKKDGKALLLSKYLLERSFYGRDAKDGITWENSDLRQRLNSDFYNAAFSAQDKKKILNTSVVTGANPVSGRSGGNTTMDHVFLLSTDEVSKYFPDKKSRIAEATAHTGYVDGYGDNGLTDWWLRSPGDSGYNMAFVNNETGEIDYSGAGYANIDITCVRPAVWVKTGK